VAFAAPTDKIKNEPVVTPDGYVPLSKALDLIAAALFPDPETGWKAMMDCQTLIRQSHAAMQSEDAITINHPAYNDEMLALRAREGESMAMEAANLLRANIASEKIPAYVFDGHTSRPRALPSDGWQRALNAPAYENFAGEFSRDHVGPELICSRGPDTVQDGVRRPVYFTVADLRALTNRIVAQLPGEAEQKQRELESTRQWEMEKQRGASAQRKAAERAHLAVQAEKTLEAEAHKKASEQAVRDHEEFWSKIAAEQHPIPHGASKAGRPGRHYITDKALFPEMLKLMEEGKAYSADGAAGLLACRAVGPATEASKKTRLAKRFRRWQEAENAGSD
jgi:hypothetical protein